jgi:ribosome-associated protein
LQPKTLARKIAALALTKKASNVVIMDLRKLTDVADYFVVCSADSDTQVKAIADAVMGGTEKLGASVWKNEGITGRQWVLLDYVDVVVHIFHKEVRKYYNLEKLWGDATVQRMEDNILSSRKRQMTKSPAQASTARRVAVRA